MTKASKIERDEQIEKLREWFPKGSTVYTILRKVSASGMSRQISVVCLRIDGDKIIDLHPNWSVSKALGYRLNKGGAHDAVVISGCGMDMGFEIAYSLASLLHGDGYALSHRWL